MTSNRPRTSGCANRIAGYIEARLADPALSPPGIAAAHHISVRRLHKLFEDQPLTVAALIRRRRLERCRAELTAEVDVRSPPWPPGGDSPDPTHFSKLFKIDVRVQRPRTGNQQPCADDQDAHSPNRNRMVVIKVRGQ